MSRSHRSLRSLSLTLDPWCRSRKPDYEVDLAPFSQLCSLRLRLSDSLRAAELDGVIRANAAHLQVLELHLRESAQLFYYDNPPMPNLYSSESIITLAATAPRPFLPALRTLDLVYVGLTDSMADAVDWSVLRSLTLRRCFGWEYFVKRLEERLGGVPLRLSRLEIHKDWHTDWDELRRQVLQRFLLCLDGGLRELHLSLYKKADTLALWRAVAGRHRGLRRLVYHQRTMRIRQANDHYDGGRDRETLGVEGREMRGLKERPAENPLGHLDLAFLGLSCVPQRLVRGAPLSLIDNLLGRPADNALVLEMAAPALYDQDIPQGAAYPAVGRGPGGFRTLGRGPLQR